MSAFPKTLSKLIKKTPSVSLPVHPPLSPQKLWKAAQPSLSGSSASAMGSLLSPCPAELWKLRRHFPRCVGQCGAGTGAETEVPTVLEKMKMLKLLPWPNANLFFR